MTSAYSISDLRRDIRAPHVWPGGYPRFFLTSDGAALSYAAVKEQRRNVLESMRDGLSDGWRVVACEVNWEDSDLTCDHTGAPIPSAYGEEAEADASPFKVEGVDSDGSRTDLGAFATSSEARSFLFTYTRTENAGGWDVIEVYDTRGATPDRLAFWERDQ